MRARSWIDLSIVALACTTSVALASAPTDQYAPFVGGDAYVNDAQTGLEWLRKPAPVRNHASARAYCAAVMSSGGQPMRVPSLKELLTLVDETPNPQYEVGKGTTVDKMIDLTAFPQIPVNENYWSDSLVAGDTGRAWTVSFANGTTSTTSVGDSRYVICVH